MTLTAMDRVEAGQAVYTPGVLYLYDLWVLGMSNHLLWRCPTRLLRDEFRTHVSDNHLDVGVGTGYYLEKCLPEEQGRIALLDLNQNSLDSAAARIRDLAPEIYCANVLDPFELGCAKFDSVSVNYLLHCLPGTIPEKGILFKNLLPHLNEGAIVFGSTILGKSQPRGLLANGLMAIYNRKGIFDNHGDTLEDLRETLEQYFADVRINVIGCVAIFSAVLRH